MEVYKSLAEVAAPGDIDVTLTMGSFDGVHTGHRLILEKVGEYFEPGEQIAGLVTFDPHPLAVIAPEKAPALLTTPKEKIHILSGFNLSYVLVLKFDGKLRGMAAGDFVEKVLVEKLGVKKLIVGYDTRFGSGGKGDVKFLEKVSGGFGFDVEVVAPVKYKGKVVSSTAVRQALDEGNVSLAAAMLGRPYSAGGPVEKGMGIGAKLGVRTANLKIDPKKHLPRRGVYSVYVIVGNERLRGVANIGVKPTIKRKEPTPVFEVHLLDFDRDLYGEALEVQFVKFLRPEQKFGSAAELVRQIRKDIDIAAGTLK